MGVLTAILLLGQIWMGVLPNIEPVTFLLLIYALIYGKWVFLIIYAFVFLEGVVYGFGVWWISYLYIWSFWAVLVLCFKENRSALFWGILAGAYGLSFGALCAVPYLFAGGPGAAFAYWASGIPYDILHCAGNFAITSVLFHPVFRLLKRLSDACLQ